MINPLPNLQNIKLARVSTVAFFFDTQLHSQISLSVKSGAEVTVIASDSVLSRPIDGVKYISVDIPREINIFKDFLALVRLWWLFQSYKFDVVHSTTPKAGLLCALAGKFAGVPIRIHSYTGQPWVTLVGVKRQVVKFADWIIGKLNTICYADSDSQKDFLVSEKIVSADKLSVIGKGSLAGVDVQRFNSNRFTENELNLIKGGVGISKDSIVLLFLGRIVKDKGVVELIEAFKRVVSECESFNIYLLLVGPSELSLVDLGVDNDPSLLKKIIFTGYTDFPERYIAISDLLCIPSYREGFGTVVLEAAAMGVPAIGSNIYGLSDAIVDGETGLLVEPRNVLDLKQAIVRVVNDATHRKKLGNNAKIRALQYFSNEVINRLVVDEYIVLLNRFKIKNHG